MKKGHAPGDSGGPLFVKSGSTFTLYGVVSWGDTKDADGYPAAGTNYSHRFLGYM